MLTHIIVLASSTLGEFFEKIFPEAGCLLNRLIECRGSGIVIVEMSLDGHFPAA